MGQRVLPVPKGRRTLTTEFFLEELKELRPAQGILDQLPEAEAPALDTQFRGSRHPAGKQEALAPLKRPKNWPCWLCNQKRAP